MFVDCYFIWGPLPRNTSLDLDLVAVKSIQRILSAFDDAVQVGLVRLRVGEIKLVGNSFLIKTSIQPSL